MLHTGEVPTAIVVVLAVVHSLLGLLSIQMHLRATPSFPPTPPPTSPVPNKPSHFCGCKAAYLHTYYVHLQSPLDTDVGEASALRAVEISEQLTQGGAALQSQTESRLGDEAASTR